MYVCLLYSAYAQQRSKLRKKNEAEKKSLSEALSNYNNIIPHCSPNSGYETVTEEAVLSGDVPWNSSEGMDILPKNVNLQKYWFTVFVLIASNELIIELLR